MEGKLIAFEGIDGSGKSTLVASIECDLRKLGKKVEKLATREAENAKLFDSVLKNYTMESDSPAYMFFYQALHAHKADRAKRALAEGKIVLVDRWDLSFFVWHENFGFLSKENPEFREGISRLAFGDLKPNLCIYLDISAGIALDRRLWRGESLENFEQEKSLCEKLLSTYRELAKRNHWICINADEGFDHVRKVVLEMIVE